MSFKIDNAIILAAGMSNRFQPISDICPKALLPVKNEVLIERQIKQLTEAEIPRIYIIVGYRAELFSYLEIKYPNVTLIKNSEYRLRNNHSSIYAARDYLKNSYICSADNYFLTNPFSSVEEVPYYSALYFSGKTDEYCLTTDSRGQIISVTIGGADSWCMMGHVCFDEKFSTSFIRLLEDKYYEESTKPLLWEQIYIDNLQHLILYIKKYSHNSILEFDSLNELKEFDSFYATHSQEELINFLKNRQIDEARKI